MATLRKRKDKWHVQIRRKDYPSQTKSFISKKTAEKWIRETENRIDQGYLHQSPEKLSLTLKELIIRYIESVLVKKRGCVNETIILKAFMRQPFVNKPLIQIRGEDFAQYRDQRLTLDFYVFIFIKKNNFRYTHLKAEDILRKL